MSEYTIVGNQIENDAKYKIVGNLVKDVETDETVFTLAGNKVYGDGGGGKKSTYVIERLNDMALTTSYASLVLIDSNKYDFIVVSTTPSIPTDFLKSDSSPRAIMCIVPTDLTEDYNLTYLHYAVGSSSANTVSVRLYKSSEYVGVSAKRSSTGNLTIYFWGFMKK